MTNIEQKQKSCFNLPDCPWLKEAFYIDDRKIILKGAGTSGRVYEMIKKKDDCHYAVKIIEINSSDSRNTAQFLEEIKIIQENPHKNIIKLYEYYLWEHFLDVKYLFLVLELGEQSLVDYIRSKDNLTELELYDINDQVIEALCFCHKKNIIHFDIKPENILYCGKNVFKICDFSSAKQTLAPGTCPIFTRSLSTSLFYAAPEFMKLSLQFNEIKDAYNWAKMDVYSLGVTTMELLGVDKKEISRVKKLSENVDEYHLNLKTSLEKIIQKKKFQEKWIDLLVKMLHINPKDRFTMEQAKYFMGGMKSTNDKKEIFKKMWEDQCLLELVFVLDITGSMDPYIKAVSETLEHNLIKLQKLKAKRKIKVAIVFFKDKNPPKEKILQNLSRSEKLFVEEKTDFHESKEFKENLREYNDYINIIDFTTKIGFIVEKLKLGVSECKGGFDTCEDLNEALKAALTLKWSPNSKLKTLVIITDAPTHGQKYHEKSILDDYLGDDQRVDNLEDSIKKLSEKGVGIVGLQINEKTKIMYNIIQSHVENNKNGQFLLTDLERGKKPSQSLNDWFKESFLEDMDSIFSNQWELYFKDKIYKSLNFEKQINWQTSFENSKIKKIGYSYEVYSMNMEVESINFYHLDHIILKEKKMFDGSGLFLQKSVLEGSQNKVYLMKAKENMEKYAIKRPIKGIFKKISEVSLNCKMYLLAKHIHNKFAEALPSVTNHFHFIDLRIVKLKEGEFNKSQILACENFLEGVFIKYNNNIGWKLPLKQGETYERNLLSQAFSHFSYDYSKGKLLICDLQGIGNCFTDPAIHSIEEFFGNTDIGEYGIYKFFKSHICNKYCKELDLVNSKEIVDAYKEEGFSEKFKNQRQLVAKSQRKIEREKNVKNCKSIENQQNFENFNYDDETITLCLKRNSTQNEVFKGKDFENKENKEESKVTEKILGGLNKENKKIDQNSIDNLKQSSNGSVFLVTEKYLEKNKLNYNNKFNPAQPNPLNKMQSTPKLPPLILKQKVFEINTPLDYNQSKANLFSEPASDFEAQNFSSQNKKIEANITKNTPSQTPKLNHPKKNSIYNQYEFFK